MFHLLDVTNIVHVVYWAQFFEMVKVFPVLLLNVELGGRSNNPFCLNKISDGGPHRKLTRLIALKAFQNRGWKMLLS